MIQWKPWKYGWGEDLSVNRFIKLSAFKGMGKNDKFGFGFLEHRSDLKYENIEDAKLAAEDLAKRCLKHGLEQLDTINHKLTTK